MKLSLDRKEENEVVDWLLDVPIFSGLPKKELKAMSHSFMERNYETGKVIETEGDKGVSFYLIMEGSVDVRKSDKSIAKLSKGQFFGELSLLDKQPRSATIVALEPTRCLIMTAWVWSGFLETQPKLAVPVMRELARRLRDADQRLSALN
jgi:CRP/FNR family transcriptional regulator, cyclic AMP receptor protein